MKLLTKATPVLARLGGAMIALAVLAAAIRVTLVP